MALHFTSTPLRATHHARPALGAAVSHPGTQRMLRHRGRTLPFTAVTFQSQHHKAAQPRPRTHRSAHAGLSPTVPPSPYSTAYTERHQSRNDLYRRPPHAAAGHSAEAACESQTSAPAPGYRAAVGAGHNTWCKGKGRGPLVVFCFLNDHLKKKYIYIYV